jgi:hypothetical protein
LPEPRASGCDVVDRHFRSSDALDWKDCRGNSVVIDGDIADLDSAGSDNAVASVFFWPGARQAS